jgi:hypothetical protein
VNTALALGVTILSLWLTVETLKFLCVKLEQIIVTVGSIAVAILILKAIFWLGLA